MDLLYPHFFDAREERGGFEAEEFRCAVPSHYMKEALVGFLKPLSKKMIFGP